MSSLAFFGDCFPSLETEVQSLQQNVWRWLTEGFEAPSKSSGSFIYLTHTSFLPTLRVYKTFAQEPAQALKSIESGRTSFLCQRFIHSARPISPRAYHVVRLIWTYSRVCPLILRGITFHHEEYFLNPCPHFSLSAVKMRLSRSATLSLVFV